MTMNRTGTNTYAFVYTGSPGNMGHGLGAGVYQSGLTVPAVLENEVKFRLLTPVEELVWNPEVFIYEVVASGDSAGSAASIVEATWIADGDVLVQGVASSLINATSLADGDVLVQGGAASSVIFFGEVEGTVLVQGAASSLVEALLAATGTVSSGPQGSIASIVDVTQTADGDVLVRGSSGSIVNVTMNADGDVLVRGTMASLVEVASALTGTNLVRGSGSSLVEYLTAGTGTVAGMATITGFINTEASIMQLLTGTVTGSGTPDVDLFNSGKIRVKDRRTGRTQYIRR